jgi:hypothetical protein
VRRPDFFIVGAPKSATTAMHEYLRVHPQVFMPDSKEFHYFGTDLIRLRTPRPTEAEYLSYFAGATDELRVGEASVLYLQSTRAAQEICQFSPKARILIMLRNPVEMMHALHGEMLSIGMEEIPDFGDALAAERDRAAGARIPAATNLVDALLYRASAHFVPQVQRYLDVFGRDRVHVLLFDDLRADTPATYRSVLEFLEVDPGFAPPFAVVNPAKRPRSQLVRDLTAAPPDWLRRIARVTVSRRLRKRAYRAVHGLNSRPFTRAPIDPVLRAQLVEEFAPEVAQLGSLLGRDLSAWSQE